MQPYVSTNITSTDIFLINVYDGFVLRFSIALNKYFGKYKGSSETEIKSDNPILNETIVLGKKISKDIYDLY